MYPGVWQILIIVLLLVLLFGRGKISELMGDVAKGIKSFKHGIADDEPANKPAEDAPATKTIDHAPTATSETTKESTRTS
ncbi:MAG: twin-arginine translocase TatA/TatE family subunit [Pseudomonadota bacterium]